MGPIGESGFKKIFDESPLGIAVLDRNDRFVLANSRLCRMLGYAYAELAKLSLADVTHPLDTDKDIAQAKQVLAGKIPFYQIEKRYIDKTGRDLWVNVTVAVFEDTADKAQYKLLMIDNFTKRKRNEELLKQSEARFCSLAEFAIDAVVRCRKAGTEVAFWNRAAEKIFGYTKEEIIDKPLSQLIPGRWRQEHTSGVKRYLAQGETGYIGQIGEFTALKKDGTEFPIEMSIGAWRNSGETSFTAIIRDITARKHLERLSQALNDINAAVNSTLDLKEILSRVVVAAAAAIGSDTGVISLHEAERWRVAQAGGPLKKLIGAGFAQDASPLIASAAKLKTSLIVEDALSDPRLSTEFVADYRLRSFILAPLIIRNEVVGAMFFNFHEAPHNFTDGEIDFADKLAGSVSLAVANARLYGAQRDIADILQEALTTIPEQLPGVELGYLYRSATEAVRIGGDFYDIFELEDNIVGILIGDVSGKGVRAATLTTVVRNTIKAYALQGDRPAVALGKTNNVIYQTTGLSDFVTLVFLVLNTQTGELAYCSAGHPPPLVGSSGETHPLTVGSPIIGAFPDIRFTEGTDRLDVGDLLVLYTDGVTEARRNKEFFGEERLIELLNEIRSPGETAGAILESITEFTGGNLLDDIAILALALESPRSDRQRLC